MKMKAYRDDAEILRMALEDGCYESITKALAKMDGSQQLAITDRRVYLVHAVPGDSGYSCFEVDNQMDMPLLLMRLGPIIGPIDKLSLRQNENAPWMRGREH